MLYSRKRKRELNDTAPAPCIAVSDQSSVPYTSSCTRAGKGEGSSALMSFESFSEETFFAGNVISCGPLSFVMPIVSVLPSEKENVPSVHHASCGKSARV